MMKKRTLASILCVLLTASMLLSLAGCGGTAQAADPKPAAEPTPAADPKPAAEPTPAADPKPAGDIQTADLMAGVEPRTLSVKADVNRESRNTVADFAIKLFQNSLTGDKNALVSPVSALYALAMTANGAKGETLAQMEAALGMPVAELNDYLYSYMQALPTGNECKLSVANSIWVRDDARLTVVPDFLQTNADYYGAGVFKSAFDAGTLKEINNWVSENTDGMIDGILNEIPDESVMYLINALAFDAEWQHIYNEVQVRDGVFTTESGEELDVKLMYSEEHAYLEDENAVGLVKYYKGGSYAFAALLPDEGVSVSSYAASLTGERLMDILGGVQNLEVRAAIPKFESEYSVELNGTLEAMGMTDAFDVDLADFSALGSFTDGNLFISRVQQKTFIAVDERGTKAGAATMVDMAAGAAMPIEEPKVVYLDRPFVYMLIDCETNLPLFIGVMRNTSE